jgi:hypothetical protein
MDMSLHNNEKCSSNPEQIERCNGDIDDDGDIDLLDYAEFARCFDLSMAEPACIQRFDTQRRAGFLDLADFAVFQRRFTGSLK